MIMALTIPLAISTASTAFVELLAIAINIECMHVHCNCYYSYGNSLYLAIHYQVYTFSYV